MTDAHEQGLLRPGAYGPFHRLESDDTQTSDNAAAQEASGELWGRTPRNGYGGWPQAKAYRGPLPSGARGVEFFTDIAPDSEGPNARWSAVEGRIGVRLEGEYAKIAIVVVKNTQRAENK